MYEIILPIVLLLVIAYAIYLNYKKHTLWQDLQVEKIRREWDLAYFYYKTHPEDFETFTKEHFVEDFSLLKKVFAETTPEEIKGFLKNGSADILPYYKNVDKFKKRFL